MNRVDLCCVFISQCLTFVLWGWFNNLMEQFNEVAFTFNGTIAYMNISTSTKMAPEKEALLKRAHCFKKKFATIWMNSGCVLDRSKIQLYDYWNYSNVKNLVLHEASYFDRINMTKNGLEYDQKNSQRRTWMLELDRKITPTSLDHRTWPKYGWIWPKI